MYIDDAHRPIAVAALRRGLDLGMTHIDTAEMYGDAEIVVGEAIAGRRDEVFLVSKVLPGNASRAGTIAACERSLDRLRTDRLDCYLLHWPGSYPLEDTFESFERLREQGKIRPWRVSDASCDHVLEYSLGLRSAVVISGQSAATNCYEGNLLEMTHCRSLKGARLLPESGLSFILVRRPILRAPASSPSGRSRANVSLRYRCARG